MLKNYGKPWTAEEDQFIREHPALTAPQLAKLMGRSRHGVRTRRHEIRAYHASHNREHVHENELAVIRENIGKVPIADIGRMLHRSANYVARVCNDYGFERKKRISDEEHQRIVDLFKQGRCRYEIVALTGRSYPCVARHIREAFPDD